MKHKHLFKNLVAVLLMLAAGQGSAWAQTFTIGVSHNSNTNKTTYTINRSGSNLPEQTIKYRTVNLSAYAGQHYTAVSGTYTFPANETSKTVEVSEESTPGTDAYKYQTSTERSYRFEVLDVNGFELAHKDRTYSTGTQFSSTKVSKSVTNLVTMSGSNFSSGMSSDKYLDVSYTPPTSQVETSGTLAGYVLIDDSYDYANKPATVSTSDLISSTHASVNYLKSIGYKIYATVCFTEKERDDGYQYLQIVAGTTSHAYDGVDENGVINNGPTNSIYKVCYELSDGSNAEGKAYFPHRGTTTSEFSLSTGRLWQQTYKSGTSGSGSGCVILDPDVSYITTRFDAGGNDDDTWGYKDFFVRMALCDATSPTLYNNSTSGITVSEGPYIKGNTFYVSVPFSEIVTVSNTPTLSSNWGTLSYVSGSGTNVLTFKGTITNNIGNALTVSGLSGTVNDLAGNGFTWSVGTKTFTGVVSSSTYTLAVTNTAFTIPNDDYWVSDNDHLPQPHPTTFYFYKGIVNSTNQVTLAETTDYTLAWSDNTAAGTGTVTATGAGSYTGSVSTTFPIRWGTYTVSFHDNGSIGIPVTGSMSDQAFEYGVAQNLSANAFNRTGYTFAGWNTAPDGSGTAYTDGQSVSGLNPEDGAVIDLYAQWTVISWTGSGDNTNDPFIILYASQLDLLASNVNAGNTYQNKFFQLGDDITYSTTGLGATESNYTAIGHNSTYYFDGTFDGNNHTISGIRIYTTANERGVFGQVGINGIVKNVVLANSTITARYCVGGIVGYNIGTLTNCRVEGSVEVLPIDDQSLRHGGIVGWNRGTVSGCISAANVDNHGIGNVRYYGGIVGDNDALGTVKDCLYTGSTVSALNYYGAIAGTNAGTLTNNYYTTENLGGVGNGQSNSSGNDCDGARRARSVTLDANVALNGDETEYDVSGLTALGTTALSYNDGTTTTIYSGEGQTLTFSHSGVPATGYVWNGFSATNGGTFSGNTLTMPAANVTVTATTRDVWGVTNTPDAANGSEAQPYLISDTTGLNLLARNVNGTHGYTANGFSGKYFKLANDITYSTEGLGATESNYTAIGCYSDGWISFNGTFDGDGHTVSGIRIYKGGTTAADGGQGLFGDVLGGTIKNVTLTDAVITGKQFVGGIVGTISMNNSTGGIIENCHVTGSVILHAVVDHAFEHGGIVGKINGGSVSGCTSAATLSYADGLTNCEAYGGIAGYLNGSLQNCLVLGANISGTNYVGAVVGMKSDNHTYTANYYRGCTVNGTANAINVGTGNNGDIAGIRSLHTLVLGDGVSATGSETKVIGDVTYYASTSTVTLGYTGTPASGYSHSGYSYQLATDHYPLTTNTLTMPAADLTVSATFTPITYNITYNLADGSLPSGQSNPATYNVESDDFTLVNPTRTGFVFIGWTGGVNSDLSTPTSDLTIAQGSTGDRFYTANWHPYVTYIDADGNSQTCTDFSLIWSTDNDFTNLGADGATHWYVVDGNVTLRQLKFLDSHSHLILMDGATLTANSTWEAIYASNGSLTIYGQAAGTGTINATSTGNYSNCITTNNLITINGGTVNATSSNRNGIICGNLTINGGSVTATTNGNLNTFSGIYTTNNITLGWRSLSDRIYASSYSYYSGSVVVKAGQHFTDGTAAYSGTLTSEQVTALAGKTLQPCFAITLPEHVTATGVISQTGTTAYALPDATVTLAVATGYTMTDVTVSNNSNNQAITQSGNTFTMPAADVTVSATLTPITYNITYDLAGGEYSDNQAIPQSSNPTTYTVETPDFTLVNPTREGYNFTGWTGSNGTTPETTVTIAQGSTTGDLTYTANWVVTPWAGSGNSENDPYIILYRSQLDLLATRVNGGESYNGKFFRLDADIAYDTTALDANGENYTAIGGYFNGVSRAFRGTFDGDGHTVSGIRINKTGSTTADINQGLFGYVINGTVRNVVLNDANITGCSYLGGIVGDFTNTCTLENCLVLNTDITYTYSGAGYSGAIAGIFSSNTTYNSNYYHNCSLTGGGTTRTADIGFNGSDRDGARAVYSLTLGTDISTTTAAAVSHNTVNYYTDGTEVSLTYGGATVPEGCVLEYTVNGNAITGNTFTMPAADATVSASISVPYVDADGNLQSCTDYTLVGSSSGNVTYGTDGQECWFVVSGDVTITGRLTLQGSSKHLILCDGATLTVTNSGNKHTAISSSGSGSTLAIYGQAAGTGTLNASTTGSTSDALYHAGSLFINGGHVNAQVDGFGSYAIEARIDLTVNGGSVQATGNGGLQAFGGNITLGWRSLSDRIQSISYSANYGSVIVKAGQHLTDGTAVYSGTLTSAQVTAIAGQTLQPCFAVTLPEHVAATGVVSQTGTTAYAIPGATVTLASDSAGYTLTDVTVSNNSNNQAITQSGNTFTMPAADVTVSATLTLATYTITYDLAGGALPSGQSNPTTYTIETPAFTLVNPTREGYTFLGWTGGANSELSTPTSDLTVTPGTTTGDLNYTAHWIVPVTYVDAAGNQQTCTDYTLVESSNVQNTYYYSPSGGGWYVVDGDVTLVNLRFYDNDAHLILKDGATLTFNRISTDSDVALTIYGQSLGTGTLNGAEISVQRDDLTINGGTLVMTPPYSNDAIQTLYNGNIVVNGGTVTATSANGNAIYSSGSLTINGGTVTATNTGDVNGSLYSQYGDITINGGIVTATAPTGFYAIVAGNNGDFTNPGCHNLNLSWTNPSDRIGFSSFAGNVRLMAGKAFVDENDHLYYTNGSGSGYNSLGYAVTGHLLTPFTDYDREFSITYHPNGGTMPATYPTTYTANTTVALPVPTREGYAFLGWSSVGMNDDVTELVAGHYLGDMELYADWAPLYTDVSYLDENGTQQTVQAKILYNTFTTFEGGIYTFPDGCHFSSPVTFTGNTTLILPDGESLSNYASDGVFSVDGNLTVYGQEVGDGRMLAKGLSATGNIALYGGIVRVIDSIVANGAGGTITLGWTGLYNQINADKYIGQVNLVKDFLYRSNDGTRVVVHAGTDIDTATINGKNLYPYFQTTTVHYLDENATRHTADATMLWGDESGTLPGGIYTVVGDVIFTHGLAFDGNTTLVLPDNSYLYFHDGNWEPIAGDGITVNGNLALYGQENRNGNIEILASGDAIHASGNITVSNVSADIYDGNGIRSDADILVAGGEYYSCGTIAAGTITLGYLTLYDHIYSDAYTGTVTVRTGQTLIDYNNYNTYSGTLTAAQVSGIEGASLEPYIENPVTRTVESYNGSENGGWVFLASPVMGSIHPDEVGYMTTGFYDLYRYNTGTDVWENYRRHYDDFMLYNGRGYLYARADTETLEFSGAYNMNSTQAVSLEQGFNLVGNPFDAAATIDRPCYKMNAEGNGLVACATGTSIAVCEGVMVYSAVGGQSVTFSRNAPGSKGGLNLKLTNADGRQLDNAVVILGGTDALEKIEIFNSQFSIFNSPASLSIPQDGHRYAVASVPTGTKAVPLALQATPGEFELKVESGKWKAQGGTYLHLIDRATGADVDLLRDSSYTFTHSSNNAIAARFLLLLAPGNSQFSILNSQFAYLSGDQLIIDGSGTLEAFDALGRELFTQEISTFNNQLSTSAFPGTGVYILRLSGQSQKIIIK